MLDLGKKRKFLRSNHVLVTFSVFLLISSFSQDICADAIDNDFDGQIDSQDIDCDHGFPFRSGFVCTIVNPPTPFFFENVNTENIGLNISDTQSKLAVGDMDGDEIPEFIVTSKWNSELRVVASRDHTINTKTYKAGAIKSSFKVSTHTSLFNFGLVNGDACYPDNLLFESEVVIADIDIDGNAEIFCIVSNRKNDPKTPPTCYYLIGFEYSAENLMVLPGYPKQLGPDCPGVPGITDFDGDGKIEVYLKNRIYAAENGTLLADGGGNWDTEINSAPVAINILGDGRQELVCGNFIYAIPSLTGRTLQQLTVAADMNMIAGLPETKKYSPKVYTDEVEYGTSNYSSTAIGDIDNDNFLDVVLSGATNGVGGETTVFYWNVNKQIVSIFSPLDPNHVAGWPWGTSRLNLADTDGDGNLNLNFTAGNQLFCLQADGATNVLLSRWTRQINTSRTGLTGCTAFDFNGDNAKEIIYRDAQELVVVDGVAGITKLWSSICQSHSFTETPLVADANGDGLTDICVPCFSYQTGFNDNDDIAKHALGTIKLVYSSHKEWMPARRVWNQPGYFGVNVNDNLSIPPSQFDLNHTFNNGGVCGVLPQKPLNGFLSQIPFLQADGCPGFPAYNLRFRLLGSEVTRQPLCGGYETKAALFIENIGDLYFGDKALTMSFFKGDPTHPTIGAELLYQTSIDFKIFNPGEAVRHPSTPGTFLSFSSPNDSYELYITIGDFLKNSPHTGEERDYEECDLGDNIYNVLIPGTLGANHVGEDRFTISWPTIPGIDNYLLDVSSVTDFSTLLTGYNKKVLPSSSTGHEVTGLNSGTVYYFRLFTESNQQSQLVCGDKQQITAPATPTLYPVTSTTTKGFTAKWNTVKGADFYEVDVSLQSDNFSVLFPGYSKVIPATNNATLTTELNGLSAGTSYVFRIRLVNAGGKSGNSLSESFTTSGAFVPMGVTISENSKGAFNGTSFQVKAVVTNAVGNYTVTASYRGTIGDEFFPVPATVSDDTVYIWVEEYMFDEEGVEIKIEIMDELNQVKQISARIDNLYLAVDTPQIIIGEPYPNPSNQSITCSVTLPYTKPDFNISLQIIDFFGRPIYTLNRTGLTFGNHEFSWDRTDTDGNTTPSGLYLLRLSIAGEKQASYRVILK